MIRTVYLIPAWESFRTKKKNSQATVYGPTGRNASKQGGHFSPLRDTVAT